MSIQEAARTLPSLFRCGGLGGTSTNLNLDKCDNFPPFHALQCSQLRIHFSAIADNALVPGTPEDSVTTGCEEGFRETKSRSAAVEKSHTKHANHVGEWGNGEKFKDYFS